MSPVDAAVAVIAQLQYGVFSRQQALEAGATPSLINRRLASGHWIRVGPGVYALPGHQPTFRRALWIALLDAGPLAVVSHRSAAAIHELKGFPPAAFELLLPHGHHQPNPIAAIHQTTSMPVPVIVDGLRVTSVARTLVDLGKVVGPRRLGAALDDAVLARKVRLDRVRAEWLRLAAPGRPGIECMAKVLEQRSDGHVPTRSQLEDAWWAIAATIPGPPPVPEVDIGGWEEGRHCVDALYRPEQVINEVDGRRWHMRVEDFARDRRRDRAAARKRYYVARWTFDEVVHHAVDVRDELLAILGR